jgi:transposase-like protein
MADRIVAEFGDGYEVEGIAARHGLTVEQVFALVEREVGPARPERYPPAPSAAPAYQLQGFANPDAIVAEYGDGHDIAMIARRHGITVEQVYLVVQQVVADDPRR